MSDIVFSLEAALSFVVVLGILVFVHEFGHFIVAKAFGIRVPVFSLGFGPRLAGFRYRETDYRVAAIPLGGYVRLAGDEADESRTGAPDEFLSRPRWQRFLVFVAGAIFNVLLALAVMTLVFWVWGRDVAKPLADPPVIAAIRDGSPAAAAGFKVGDKVLTIGGADARDPKTQGYEIVLSPDQVKPVTIERDGKRLTLDLPTGQDPVYHLGAPGWHLFDDTAGPTRIAEVFPGDPAAAAGLLPGDKILSLDGQAPEGMLELQAKIQKSANRPVTLEIDRAGKTLSVTLTPKDEGGTGKIGVEFVDGSVVHFTLGPVGAFLGSLDWARSLSGSVFVTLGKFFRGEIGARAFSGPIEIARVSRAAAMTLHSFLAFLAFISLQLGIFNLLPIPVLDGGHIMLLGIEAVIRRDLSEKLKERVTMVGLVALLLFFVAVMYFDVDKIRRLFSS